MTTSSSRLSFPHLPPQPQRMAVWVFDASVPNYLDKSAEARSSAGTAFPIFETTSDYLYLGMEERFDLAIFFLSVAGEVGDRTWQYYDGDSWNVFSPGIEYDFSEDGGERFDRLLNWQPLLLSTTAPHTANSVPDQIPRFWIRASVASVTTAPTGLNMLMRPYGTYATAKEVSEILQLGYEFTADTVPSKSTVEDFIHNAQSFIDQTSRKSWRPNIQYDEEHDFERAGTQLKKSYATNILKLGIWNGGSYDIKTQGRHEDYFLVKDQNMIYYARFFILPARIQSYGVWGFGHGEFSKAVRMTYVYGSNIWSNELEGGIVNDIAKKMAAIDVFTSHDYSIIATSGADRISLERKVDLWREETVEKAENLRGWEVF